MSTIAIRFDPDTRYRLDMLARATGQSRSFLVAEAVRRFVVSETDALLANQSLLIREASDTEEKQPPVTPERWNVIV